MANEFNPNVAGTMAGLGDFSCTIITAGLYTAEIKTTIPLSSDVEILIKKNSSTLITIGGVATNPSPTQQSMGGSTEVALAAGDVLHFVLSSSNAVDAVPNNVKSVVNVYLGQ